ncbi:MAG: ABC transporter permease [Planctomycetota bacterium]|nr:ABC transporter permease [Planctomycetota bacterium]
MKTFQVARREFASTVMTAGFLVGVLLMPVMMFVAIAAASVLMSEKPPKVEGSVAIIDRAASPDASPVIADVKARLSPESLAAEYQRDSEQAMEAAKKVTEAVAPGGAQQEMIKNAAIAAAIGQVPKLTIEALPKDADFDREREPLLQGTAKDGGRLALVVVAPDAVSRPSPDQPFGNFEILAKHKLDDRVQRVISGAVRDSIEDARVRAAGLDPAQIRALTDVPRPIVKTATAEGDKTGSAAAQILVPFAFMILLMASVFTGGQYLLTTTVEEKASRVMEVLLSAVSPVQLMAGKIIGQMGAGLLVLAIYLTLGLSGLAIFNRLFLIDPINIVFLVLFFFIAFFLIGSLFAAVGSAVQDLREAQTLLGPIMTFLIIPWLLVMPLSRNPNSMLAQVLTFVPGLNPFVMVVRLGGTEPIPLWQTLCAIAIGLASVLFAVWAASKVFRIGVLMYGKPPNFRTLVKWIRMA